MNIELIKWMASKAEGFEVAAYGNKKELWFRTGYCTVIGCTINDKSDEWMHIWFPRLLDKAIESLNRIDLKFGEQSIDIEITKEGVFVNHNEPIKVGDQEGVREGFTPFEITDDRNIVQAKQAALIYIRDKLGE